MEGMYALDINFGCSKSTDPISWGSVTSLFHRDKPSCAALAAHHDHPHGITASTTGHRPATTGGKLRRTTSAISARVAVFCGARQPGYATC